MPNLYMSSDKLSGFLVFIALRFRAVLCLAVVLELCPTVPVSAEDISWPNPPGNGVLVTIDGEFNSLGPSGSSTGKSTSLSGNTVTVHSGTIGGSVYGAINWNDTETVTNNQVVINDGDIGDIYGGCSNAGNVESNRVTINDGDIGDIYGGWSNAGNVESNRVTINDGDVASASASAYGGYSYSGKAMSNSVIINGGTVLYEVYGGWSRDGVVESNSVTINGGTVLYDVRGGYSRNGVVESNSVTIKSGCIFNINANAYIAGGFSLSGVVKSNSVIINGIIYGDEDDSYIYGGRSSSGNSYSNNVTITNGTVNDVDEVFGGWSGSGNSYSNNVTITNGTVNNVSRIIGGRSNGGVAESNSVNISDSTIVSEVNGGRATNGKAESNSVTINDSTISPVVYGGWGSADATGNSVTINGSTAELGAYGGYSRNGNSLGNSVTFEGVTTIMGGVYGGYSVSSGDSKSNSVSIKYCRIDSQIIGGHSGVNGAAESNTVTINESTVNGTVRGGLGVNDATNNSVSISRSTIKKNNDVYGGWSVNGNAANNSVTINDSTVTSDDYTPMLTIICGGLSVNGDATNNRVTIHGGTIDAVIHGGWADGDAVNNTLTISGTPIFGEHAVLFGGWAGDSGDAFSGNTFNLHSSNITVRGLYNFENLNFFLPANIKNGDTMLRVIENPSQYFVDENIDTGKANIDGSKISVAMSGASMPLKPGDKVILIDAVELEGDFSEASIASRLRKGVTLSYDAEIKRDDINPNRLVMVLPGSSPEVNPQTKDFSKGFLAGVSLLNQGGDLVSWHGMSGAGRAAREARHGGCGIFFDMSGGWSRYSTGSHVDLSSLSLMTGVSKFVDLGVGHLTVGAFFEHGNGSYDTDSMFIDADPVRGNGNLRYFGGGVLGRMDFDMFGSSHYYAEASFRAGGLKNGYFNADLFDGSGLAAKYDSASAYYGLHLGGGKLWNLSNMATFDLYTKYLWTGLQRDAVTLSTGEDVDFRSVNSHRVRLGGRFTSNANTFLKPYLGGAWEYEFNGDARATTGGHAIDVPTLRGSTGIAELGIAWKSTANKTAARGLYADLGVQGYGGKREGIAASLTIGKVF